MEVSVVIREVAAETIAPRAIDGTGRTTETTEVLKRGAAKLSKFRKEYNKYKALKFFGGTNVQKVDD